MTREEAKKLLPIIKAFAEGKTIQSKQINAPDTQWRDIEECNFLREHSYRIKPESKCRPFRTQEECWEEMHKHPDFGWVKSKSVLVSIVRIDYQLDGDLYFTINGTGGNCAINTNYMFECYTFADGTPFGVKEE